LIDKPTILNGLVEGLKYAAGKAVEGADFPIAVANAAWDWSQGAGSIVIQVFTPDANQSDTVPVNGVNMQSPQAAFDSGQVP